MNAVAHLTRKALKKRKFPYGKRGRTKSWYRNTEGPNDRKLERYCRKQIDRHMKDQLRPGERARARRIAPKIAHAILTATNGQWWCGAESRLPNIGTLNYVVAIIQRLKDQRLGLVDLDTPSGQDAITTIAMSFTWDDWLNGPRSTKPLGRTWSWIAGHARNALDRDYAPKLRRTSSGAYRITIQGP